MSEEEFTQVVKEYDRYIKKVVCRYYVPGMSYEDLRQEALTHLWVSFMKGKYNSSLNITLKQFIGQQVSDCIFAINKKSIRPKRYHPDVLSLDWKINEVSKYLPKCSSAEETYISTRLNSWFLDESSKLLTQKMYSIVEYIVHNYVPGCNIRYPKDKSYSRNYYYNTLYSAARKLNHLKEALKS